MKKIVLFGLLIFLFFLSGCGGIAGAPIPKLLVTALIPAIIFYIISISFIGIGLLIKKLIAQKFKFEENKLKISIVSAIIVFVIFNIPLLLIDPDIAMIFFYLITPCSFAVFLGMYKDTFWKNASYLLILMAILILIFAIDLHGPYIVITKIYRIFRIF